LDNEWGKKTLNFYVEDQEGPSAQSERPKREQGLLKMLMEGGGQPRPLNCCDARGLSEKKTCGFLEMALDVPERGTDKKKGNSPKEIAVPKAPSRNRGKGWGKKQMRAPGVRSDFCKRG